MPPRKVDKSPEKPAMKKPREREKKPKPVLKTPSVLKLKIKSPSVTPNGQNTENEVMENKDVKEVKKPVIRKKTTIKRQPVKKKTLNGEQATNKDSPVKRKGRNKVPVKNNNTVETKGTLKEDNINNDVPESSSSYFKVLLANQGKLPIEHVLPEKKAIVKKEPISNAKAVKKKATTGKTPTKKMPVKTKTCDQRKKVPNAVALVETECKPNVITKKESKDSKMKNDTKIAKVSYKRKRTLSFNSTVVKAGPKSREKLSSIVNEKKKCNTEENDTEDQMYSNKCVKIVSFDNINKAAANSNKSWTKDISTSSNSSLVTVLSKDFYFFDNKIPILQLSNIDKELLKNNKKIISDNCVEDSRSIAENNGVIKGALNETDKQYSYFHNKCTLSSTSSSSLDTNKNCYSQNNRIENFDSLSKENVGASSLDLSTSSTSSSSLSSRRTSSVTNESMSMPNLGNGMVLEKNVDEQQSVSRTDKLLNTKTVLQKLNLSISKFDINKIKLSQNKNKETNNETNITSCVTNMQDKIFRDEILKDETDLCSLCQAIMQLEIDDVGNRFNHNEFLESTRISRSITPESSNSQDETIITERENRNESSSKQNIDNTQPNYSPKRVEAVAVNEIPEKIDENCLVYNNPNHTISADNDDDDALSLFAESLTEIETSRKNSTFNSEKFKLEEYIPQPIVKHAAAQSRPFIKYQPTKISNRNVEIEASKCTSIRENQKADSTLLFDNISDLRENTLIHDDRINKFAQVPVRLSNIVSYKSLGRNTPRLMAFIHKPVPGRRSLVFKGCCYFHITSTCQKPNCTFLHVYINVEDIKNSLKMLNEESFIQEYMLLRAWPKLRRRYGLCFVEECMRRELTRILVEMAIDFIVKSSISSTEDKALKSEVVDNVLMYLNQVDLSTCDDLLGYNIRVDRMLLCDFFISVIATSQNFSRFKSVFINLTDFMYQNGRTFSVDVAESILERLCILPYDELLARALLKILQNTDVIVLSNKKISDLERQLQAANSDLIHELKLLKDQALVNQPIIENHCEKPYEPLLNMDAYKNTNFGQTAKNIIRQNIGNVNESPIATKFTMTINLQKLEEKGFQAKPNMNSMKCDVKNPFVNAERNLIMGINEKTNGGLEHGVINSTTKQTRPNILGVEENPNTISYTSTEHVVKNQGMTWTRPCNIRVGENSNPSNATQNRVMKPFNNGRKRRYNNFCKRTLMPPQLPRPPGMPFKRHSDRSFEGSAVKFKRNSGPNHYQRDPL